MSSPKSSVAAIPPSTEIETMELVENNNKSSITTTTATTCIIDESWTVLGASSKAMRTKNPIRAIVDPIVEQLLSGEVRDDAKENISLALGDPTTAGNLPPCPVALQAIQETIATAPHAASYVPAVGLTETRQAIARYHSFSLLGSDEMNMVHCDNVIVANGCSGALELAITALLDVDSILLVPQPGFPLYQVIAESHGATVVHYRLDPHRSWECDLSHLHELTSQYGNQIKAMVVNNPGNPTGAVFSYHHLQEIVQFCQQVRLPIIADEIYGHMVYGEHEFYPMASIAARMGRQVPVITASGIGKQFLLPGWRVGWIVFQDNEYHSLSQVQAGAKRLAQVILGASHLAQKAVAPLLADSLEIHKWKCSLRSTLHEQATFVYTKLQAARPALQVSSAAGAMYMLVTIQTELFDDSISDDLDFTKLLLKEENVFVLPGTCFGLTNVFRIVFCPPISVLNEASDRILAFCRRHASL